MTLSKESFREIDSAIFRYLFLMWMIDREADSLPISRNLARMIVLIAALLMRKN